MLLLAVLAGSGCGQLSRLPAVPATLTEQATALGIPDARFWPDTQAAAIVRLGIEAYKRERAARPDSSEVDLARVPVDYLAISGGSDNGAFGAGLLVGWTENGTRPSFKLVTGISTGALIAPFAFLGPAYDAQLRTIYTNVGPDDIYDQRSFLSAIFSDALAGTDPLYRLISRYVDSDLLAAIAREYAKGRLLLIGTTNLDVERPVLWNIGAIASSGNPGALDLFRKILLASASVPGVFPPVMIDVEAGGTHYQEMHVDGGAVAQTILIPPQIGLMVDLRKGKFARIRREYIIRNARLDPDWSSVDRRLLSISGRAISTMIHYSGYNDVGRIYATAKHDGIDYNLAYIGKDFNVEHVKSFDTHYMRALFDYGYREGRKGYAWHKAPPIVFTPDLGRPLNE